MLTWSRLPAIGRNAGRQCQYEINVHIPLFPLRDTTHIVICTCGLFEPRPMQINWYDISESPWTAVARVAMAVGNRH